MKTAIKPLALSSFPQLAAGNLVNELGNWLGEVALAILVFDRTGSALATAALFLAMQFVPALTGPPLVARLEPLGARRSLPALYLGEAVAFAALALIAGDFALAAILVLAAIDGSLASASRAITKATAAALLAPRGMLREGNTVLNVGFTAGAAAGPAIGGALVAGAGVQTALLADSASFLVVAMLLASARRIPAGRPVAGGVLERLREGIGYVRERPLLRWLFAGQAAAFVFFSLVIPIEVVFVKQSLGAGSAGYGVFLTAWGVGMVSGGVALAGLRRVALPALIAASTGAIGLAYLGIAAAPTLGLACAASVVGGVGNGVQWVALVTAIQDATDASFQGRVVAMLESVARAMPGAGFVLGGVLTALLGPRASYTVAGAGVLAVLAVAVVSLRRAGWAGRTMAEPAVTVAEITAAGP